MEIDLINNKCSPREETLKTIEQGVKGKLPKGELCINDSVIRSTLKCDNVGFDERKEFINSLGLDIFTISPICSSLSQRLPEPKDFQWTDIDKWTKVTSSFTFAIVDGAFESGMRIIGLHKFFKMMYDSSLYLKEFVNSIEMLNISLIRQLAEKGVNGIILADDIAYQNDLLISPKILREYFFLSLERQVKVIHKLGLQVFYHSDGNYIKVIDDIINAGFDGVHCIDKNSGMNICYLQQITANKICLWGHLDINDINQSCDETFQKELIVKTKKISDKKRFILGTNSGLFDGMGINLLKTIYHAL